MNDASEGGAVVTLKVCEQCNSPIGDNNLSRQCRYCGIWYHWGCTDPERKGYCSKCWLAGKRVALGQIDQRGETAILRINGHTHICLKADAPEILARSKTAPDILSHDGGRFVQGMQGICDQQLVKLQLIKRSCFDRAAQLKRLACFALALPEPIMRHASASPYIPLTDTDEVDVSKLWWMSDLCTSHKMVRESRNDPGFTELQRGRLHEGQNAQHVVVTSYARDNPRNADLIQSTLT